MTNEKTTFSDFLRNIKLFLLDLLKTPFTASPSEFLSKRGFTRGRLITLLLRKDIIKRKEKVVVSTTDSGEKKVVHNLKYCIIRKNFERKVKRIYIQFFESNLPERNTEVLSEDGEGACYGATSASACNNSAPIMPMSSELISRPSILFTRVKKDKNEIDPTEINGKTLNVERKRNFHFTEEQIKKIKKRIVNEMEGGSTTTSTVGSETLRGDLGFDSPKAISLDTKDPSITKDGRSPKQDIKSLFYK